MLASLLCWAAGGLLASSGCACCGREGKRGAAGAGARASLHVVPHVPALWRRKLFHLPAWDRDTWATSLRMGALRNGLPVLVGKLPYCLLYCITDCPVTQVKHESSNAVSMSTLKPALYSSSLHRAPTSAVSWGWAPPAALVRRWCLVRMSRESARHQPSPVAGSMYVPSPMASGAGEVSLEMRPCLEPALLGARQRGGDVHVPMAMFGGAGW
jgi:hypothetical protein